MLKVVPDTNVLIKGFLSNRNNCRKIINLAINGKLIFYGNDKTYEEFLEVIDYPNIVEIRNDQLFTKDKLISEYEAIVIPIQIKDKYKDIKICVDEDDDELFKTALSGESNLIVSEDKKHVLKIKKHANIYTLSPERLLELYSSHT